jgi:hypothetical protein
MSDLIKRLQDAKRIAPGWKSYEPNPLCQEAASMITELVSALGAAEGYISVDTDIPAADAVLAIIRAALQKARKP